MRQYLQLAVATTLLLAATGCATPAVNTVGTVPVATATMNTAKAAASRQIVADAITKSGSKAVKDLGYANGASVAVSITVPSAKRTVQALQHRWTSADIKQYTVTLLAKDAGGYFTEVESSLTIDAASYNTSTTNGVALAAFTGIEAGKEYKVEVTAWGWNATTEATDFNQQLNTQTEGVALFDFREDENANIEDTPPAQTVDVVLDSYEFGGTATVNAQVTDGTRTANPNGVQATAIIPKADGLYRVSNTEDVVQPGSYAPDGAPDLHLQWIHTFAQPTVITRFDAWFPWGGYNTAGDNQFLVHIFNAAGGHFPDLGGGMPNLVPAGRHVFDVYLPSAVGGDHELASPSLRFTAGGEYSPNFTVQYNDYNH